MKELNLTIVQIHDLCQKFRVETLYVFGSVAQGNAKPESDLDLLVYFQPIPLLEYADNFFDFRYALEELLGKKIDLVSGKALRNPYFIEELNQTRKLIYGTENKKMLA